MVILDGSSSTMGIKDLNVYSGNVEWGGPFRQYKGYGNACQLIVAERRIYMRP